MNVPIALIVGIVVVLAVTFAQAGGGPRIDAIAFTVRNRVNRRPRDRPCRRRSKSRRTSSPALSDSS